MDMASLLSVYFVEFFVQNIILTFICTGTKS